MLGNWKHLKDAASSPLDCKTNSEISRVEHCLDSDEKILQNDNKLLTRDLT